ncbi:MAG: LysM peptidoglycan-binding domain-containing protein, partial [Firmicutes bacterium]|nr:LysM peptidoglycan-binding domain-containing protein [Bacillota bacterium]
MATGRVPAACPPGWTRRRVFPEETIDSLTHFAGITREQFLAANPHIRFPSEVRPGDVVCLPAVRTCPAGSMAMRVFAGVTLRQIAAAQGITLAALMALNPHLAGVGPDVRLFGGTLVCVPAAPLRCPPGWGPYVVQPGDTLFLLARRFGTTVEALLGANPQIVSPEQLRAGMVICVPVQIPPPPPPPPPCPPGWGTYRVQPGDTLFNIARRFGTTVEQLLRANPQITRPELIFPGQILCVPVAPVCPAGWRPYVVRPGDTLWDIARRAGITLTALIRANPQIPDPNRIFPGDIVCVPATAPMGAGTEGLAGLAGGTVAAEGQAQPGEGKPAPAGAAVSAAGVGSQALAETGFGFQQIVCPVGWEPYIVRSGDTLFTLAQRFGTTIDALLANNPEIVNPNQLQIGQQICVPRRPIAACPAGWAPYVVRTGDTLSSIAVAFGTTVSELLRMNPQITNPEL